MPSGHAGRLASAYDRYGPGRLPGAERRDVGGGYAFASTTFAFGILFVSNHEFGVGWWSSWPAFLETPLHYVTAIALLAGCGFLAGVLTWRYLPERLPYSSLSCGLAASGLTHLLVGLVFDVVVVFGVDYTTIPEKIVGVVVAYPGIVYLATRDLLDVAVALYLFGVPGGYVYERVRHHRSS